MIKSWSLENYMLTDESAKENMPLIQSWKAHLDSINRYDNLTTTTICIPVNFIQIV